MFEDFKQAFHRYNNAHVQLIIINVTVFLAMVVLKVFSHILKVPDFFTLLYEQLAIPASFQDFIHRPWTIITYAFVHDLGDIFHILFNMLIFYWFGRLFVEYLGSDKLIAVYVLGALFGAMAYLLAFNFIPYYQQQIPMLLGMVGASAAVNAVVVACAILVPNYTFYLLFLGPVKIKYIALFFVITSYMGTLGANAGGNIAHLGGALIGFIYIKQLQAGSDWGKWVTIFLDWVKELFKPSPNVKVSYRNDSKKKKSSEPDKVSQDEIDAILDKISEGGYESLTREEKEKLFNASKKS